MNKIGELSWEACKTCKNKQKDGTCALGIVSVVDERIVDGGKIQDEYGNEEDAGLVCSEYIELQVYSTLVGDSLRICEDAVTLTIFGRIPLYWNNYEAQRVYMMMKRWKDISDE